CQPTGEDGQLRSPPQPAWIESPNLRRRINVTHLGAAVDAKRAGIERLHRRKTAAPCEQRFPGGPAPADRGDHPDAGHDDPRLRSSQAETSATERCSSSCSTRSTIPPSVSMSRSRSSSSGIANLKA